MSFQKDLVEGAAFGLLSAALDNWLGGNVVETCCQRLGWSIDERTGSDQVCLDFKDAGGNLRRVLIADYGTAVGFTAFSNAILPAQQVPAAVLAYLLQRNGGPLFAWRMIVEERGSARFLLTYCALAAGVDHNAFKVICEGMVNEAHSFDAKMSEAGLLR